MRRLLDSVGSVWFGVTVLALLLVYSSVGSAIPSLRQMRIFEMTEFEWFNWWPFVVLSALLCIALSIVTVRRIPLTRINLGVWMIHTGVVLLCVSSAHYFLTKIEGDTPVLRRTVVVTAPGGASESFVALTGNVAQVGDYGLQVVETQPDWPILTGDDAGKSAYAVRVAVQTPERSFIRQLLAGYPQYTEDIVPGQGRAVNITGERLLDPALSLELAYAPQDEFFLKDTRALYVRALGETEWAMRTLSGLPRYNDYVGSLTDVWLASGETLRPDPLNERAAPTTDDALAGADVRVTGFLRYAFEQERWAEGGRAHYPALDLSLHGPGASQGFTLAAFDPAGATTPGGEIALLWVDTEAALTALTQATPPTVAITVIASGATTNADTTRTLRGDPSLDFTPIGEGGYAYRIRRFDNTPVGAFAAVDLRTPEGEVTRWLSDEGDVMDVPLGSTEETARRPTDASVRVDFTPGRSAPPIAIVAGPNPTAPPRVLVSDDGVNVRVASPRIGEPVAVNERVQLVLERYSAHAQFQTKPAIVPRRQRDRDAGELFSMIRVEVTHGGQTISRWLPFNTYVFPSAEYAYQGRFRFEPVLFTLPDGRAVELLFSRERRALPAPVALDEFVLTAHVGGFTGQQASIRDWTSQIRFLEDGAWSERLPVSTNKPAEHAGYWFFQQSWDPPQPEQGVAGMNFTGLGIGNRNGVHAMLAGSTLSVIGMLYAFYVKPILKRRRASAVLAALAESHRPNRTSAPTPQQTLAPAGVE